MRRKFWAVFASITLAIFNMSFTLAIASAADAFLHNGDTIFGGPIATAAIIFLYAAAYGAVLAYVAVMPVALLLVKFVKPKLAHAVLLSLSGTLGSWYVVVDKQPYISNDGFPFMLCFLAILNAWLCWRLYLRIMRGQDAPNLAFPG